MIIVIAAFVIFLHGNYGVRWTIDEWTMMIIILLVRGGLVGCWCWCHYYYFVVVVVLCFIYSSVCIALVSELFM